MGRNLAIKGVAFVITIFLCLNAETNRMVEVECSVPVLYSGVPDSLVRMGEAPGDAQVRVIFNRKFWQVQPGNMRASIDLSGAQEGTRRYPILPSNVNVPHDRKARVLDVVEPKRVALTFEKKETRLVDVAVLSEGVPAEHFVIFGEPSSNPDQVSLIGARSLVQAVEAVYTEPLALAGAKEDVRQTVAIDLSPLGEIRVEPAEVEVFFNIEKIEDRILTKRPIRTSPRFGVNVEPDSIDIVVRGPGAMLAEIPENRIRLSLNVAPLPAGEYAFLSEVIEGNRIRWYARPLGEETAEPVELPELEGSVQNLPDEVVLIDFSPKVFRIIRGG